MLVVEMEKQIACSYVRLLPLPGGAKNAHNPACLLGCQAILSPSILQADPRLLPSLPVVLLLSHYSEEVDWILQQPYPVIIYEKRPPPHSLPGTSQL